MKNKLSFFLAFFAITLFSFCTSTKKTTSTSTSDAAAKPAFTYEKDVAPIIQASCAPCHFSETGKVKYLDTYGAASKNIEEILKRVQLPVDHEGYMPLQSKKPALTDRQIAVLKKWQEDNTPK